MQTKKGLTRDELNSMGEQALDELVSYSENDLLVSFADLIIRKMILCALLNRLDYDAQAIEDDLLKAISIEKIS